MLLELPAGSNREHVQPWEETPQGLEVVDVGGVDDSSVLDRERCNSCVDGRGRGHLAKREPRQFMTSPGDYGTGISGAGVAKPPP